MAEETSSTSWLQRQQEKLRERKDSLRRTERRPHEARLINELRTAQQVKGQQQQRPGNHFTCSHPVAIPAVVATVAVAPSVGLVYKDAARWH